MIRTERYVINVVAEDSVVNLEIENPEDLKHDSVFVQLDALESARLIEAITGARNKALMQGGDQ